MPDHIAPALNPEDTGSENIDNKESLAELYIPEEIKELIESLPGEQRKVVIAIISYQSLTTEATSWKGPLPPPDILKGYNDAVPDGAE